MNPRKILYLPPTGLSKEILSPNAAATLERLGTVVWNELDRNYTADELLELIPGAEVIITSWGSPNITDEHSGRSARSENRRPRRGDGQNAARRRPAMNGASCC